jgi:hypothetical protein
MSIGYYTTVIVINAKGKYVQAEVKCGGNYQGFTKQDDEDGMSFYMKTNEKYSLSVKYDNKTFSSSVNGGSKVVVRVG